MGLLSTLLFSCSHGTLISGALKINWPTQWLPWIRALQGLYKTKTKSSTYPTYPSTYPTYPVTYPTYPATYPTYPVGYPTYPAGYPTYPGLIPQSIGFTEGIVDGLNDAIIVNNPGYAGGYAGYLNGRFGYPGVIPGGYPYNPYLFY